MTNQFTKTVAAALLTGLTAGSVMEAIQANPAAAATPTRTQVVNALSQINNIPGCNVNLFPTQRSNRVGISCNNQAVAGLLNPYFSQSGFQIYAERGWRGRTKMDWRIGPQQIRAINFRQPASRTVDLGRNPILRVGSTFSPLDIRVKVHPRISSTTESVTAIRGGLKLTIPFSQARLYCEGDPVGPGGWLDRACPDITWSNPKINVNLIFNRDLTLSRASAATTSGSFALGGLRVVSSAKVNRVITDLGNNGLQQLIPTANRYISKFAKASVISRYTRLPESCINLNYNNDKLNFSIPLNRTCAPALGLPVVTGPGDPPEGQDKQSLKLEKSYRIKDDETFRDEFKNHSSSKTIRVRRGETSNFKRSNQSSSPKLCAGGEVRLEDWDRVDVENDGTAKLWIAMELYEGTSCNSRDLDGKFRQIDRGHDPRNNAPFITVRPGDTVTLTKKVNNTDEGGDYGRITYKLTNTNMPR
jgi:hypothetical protein